jgi:hypothetical protein
MTNSDPSAIAFSATERAYIRQELDQFFGTLPSIAEGFQLRTWRTGLRKDQPKVPPVGQGLIDRGLMHLDTAGRLPRLFFTEAGLLALQRMMADRRFADPEKFAHVRKELGLDSPEIANAAE